MGSILSTKIKNMCKASSDPHHTRHPVGRLFHASPLFENPSRASGRTEDLNTPLVMLSLYLPLVQTMYGLHLAHCVFYLIVSSPFPADALVRFRCAQVAKYDPLSLSWLDVPWRSPTLVDVFLYAASFTC